MDSFSIDYPQHIHMHHYRYHFHYFFDSTPFAAPSKVQNAGLGDKSYYSLKNISCHEFTLFVFSDDIDGD